MPTSEELAHVYAEKSKFEINKLTSLENYKLVKFYYVYQRVSILSELFLCFRLVCLMNLSLFYYQHESFPILLSENSTIPISLLNIKRKAKRFGSLTLFLYV